MIDIVIVGYPKSGNTWVTRLVAEIVECPVAGFLGSDHDEIAREGLRRKSEYQCLKAHHQLHELRAFNPDNKKIIYVIRDPRDICISGSWYFKTEIKKMAHTILYGAEDGRWWCRIPWATHYKPYLKNNYFFVKYEDILCEPVRECKRIAAFLELERGERQIQAAIKKQSFKNKKNAFLKNNQIHKANHMRVGKKEQWKQELSDKYKTMFRKILADDLSHFGYPTDSNM